MSASRDTNGIVVATSVASGAHSMAVGRDAINSIFVSGNGAKVFVGDYIDLAKSYINPRQVFERVQLEYYFPRHALDSEVDRFLGDADRGYLFIEGSAGLGKSTYAAHLAKTRNFIHHFVELCPGAEGEQSGIRNLAAQLAVAWRLFDEFDQHIAWATIGPEFLQNLIFKAAIRRDELAPDEKIVILIDALDEAAMVTGRNVFNLPRQLPAGVYIICTQRQSETSLSITTRRQVLRLTADSFKNREDLRHYLEAVATRPRMQAKLDEAQFTREQFVSALLEKSQGVWIYVQFLIFELDSGTRTPHDLTTLPIGLWCYYRDFFGAWAMANPAAWSAYGIQLLTALVAAQEDLPLELLCKLSGIRNVEACKALLIRHWAPFVLRSPQVAGGFRLYHASTRDFVLGRLDSQDSLQHHEAALVDDMLAELTLRHRAFADFYQSLWRQFFEVPLRLAQDVPDAPAAQAAQDGIALYGARYLPLHLAECQAFDELHALLAKGAAAVNVWYDFKLSHNDLGGYSTQLRLAAACVPPRDLALWSAEKLVLVMRYAWMTGSLTSTANSSPSEYIGYAVDSGKWPIERAIQHAQHCEQGSRRASAYEQLLPRTQGKQHAYCLAELIKSIRHVDGHPRSHFQLEMWQSVLSGSGRLLTENDFLTIYEAITSTDMCEERWSVLNEFARQPIGHAMALRLYEYAWQVPATADLPATLNDSFVPQRFELSVLSLEIFPLHGLTDYYEPIIEALLNCTEMFLFADALRVLDGSKHYNRLAAMGVLPGLPVLVEQCLALYQGDTVAREIGAIRLLPLLEGKRKIELFNDVIAPYLQKYPHFELTVQIATDNPELRDILIDSAVVQADEDRFSAASLLGKMAAFSPRARTCLNPILFFSNTVDALIYRNCLDVVATGLDQPDSARLTALILALFDRYSVAKGLAYLALARGPESDRAGELCIEHAMCLDTGKTQEVLGMLARSGIAPLVELAFRASQVIHDGQACIYFLCALMSYSSDPVRETLLDHALSLLPQVASEWDRFAQLERLLGKMDGTLGAAQELRVLAAFDAHFSGIPSMQGKLHIRLAGAGNAAGRGAHILGALALLPEMDGRTRIELLDEIWPLVTPEDQDYLRSRAQAEIAILDEGDRRYIIGACRTMLAKADFQQLCRQVIEDTHDDKLYALDQLCKAAEGQAVFDLYERAIDCEVDQLFPHLAGALARLGHVSKALSVAAQASQFTAISCYETMAPYLDLGEIDTVFARLHGLKMENRAYAVERKDDVIAALAMRLLQMGEGGRALQLAAAIAGSAAGCAARIMLARFMTDAQIEECFAQCLAVCTKGGRYCERKTICTAVNSLSSGELSMEKSINFFSLNVMLSACEGRSETYYTLASFIPSLVRHFGDDLCALLLAEIRSIHRWWP
jgi:hypothetical protein